MCDLVYHAVAKAPAIGKCRLTKLKGGSALRTPIVEGEMVAYPIKGRPFFMRTTPLQDLESECRIINTSVVMEVEILGKDDMVSSDLEGEVIGVVLTTKSGSKYLLEMQA